MIVKRMEDLNNINFRANGFPDELVDNELRKGYEIEVTEKLYSNEVLKVKLLDGRYKGRFYYAIADDLTKKYLLEEKEEENEDS